MNQGRDLSNSCESAAVLLCTSFAVYTHTGGVCNNILWYIPLLDMNSA